MLAALVSANKEDMLQQNFRTEHLIVASSRRFVLADFALTSVSPAGLLIAWTWDSSGCIRHLLVASGTETVHCSRTL